VECQGVLEKLIIDAGFYLLPGLKEEAEAQLETLSTTHKAPHQGIVAKLTGGILNQNGGSWAWNTTIHLPVDYFTLSPSKDTITIVQAGVYMVLCRTAFTNSSNGVYMSLFANDVEIARCYNCFNTNYTASTQINEVFNFQANTRLRITQTYNNGPTHGDPINQFSVLYLSP